MVARRRWLLALAAFLLPVGLAAQAAPPALAADAPLGNVLPLDPRVQEGKLDNGLTYLVRQSSRPENRADLWLVVNAGSLQEDDDQLGLAHFIEHMAFNGTRHFPRQAMVDYLESVGLRFGPDLNAYTSFDETVYMLRVPIDRAGVQETAFDILVDWASGGISFDPEEVDKERGVVIEEWRQGRGAEARILDHQLPVLFQGSRYAERPTIGQREVLATAKPETLRRFYRDWYRPDLMCVIAVGDFDPTAVVAQIRRKFAGIPAAKDPRPRQSYGAPPHAATLFNVATDPEATSTSVAVYYKRPPAPEDHYGDYRRLIVENVYDSLMNARLAELARQPDPPFLYGAAASDRLVRGVAAYLQVAGVEPSGVGRGLEALLTEAERVDRHGFTASELERAKKDFLRSYQQANLEREKTDSRNLAAEYSRHFLTGEPIPGIALETALVERFLPTITLDEINHLARDWISEDSRVILVSAPEDKAASLPSKEDLLASFERVKALEIKPYVDQVLDEPLMAEKPQPGSIVAERQVPEVGVTEWRLSNGALVVLKPTDFKNDQILLSAFSPGGNSLISDADFNSSIFATYLVDESGLGKFSKSELDKALAGKRLGLNPYIGELSEGLGGGASPQDFETLLQLLYLSITAPKIDDEAGRSFLSKLGVVIDHRLDSPDTVFEDKLTDALAQHHPRKRPLTREVLGDIHFDTALRSFRDRFGDISDFTFILVGNFEPKAIRPLVETYLASLPGNGRKETFRDIGVTPPEGVVRVEVEKGLEPKSQVRLYFRGAAPWSRDEVFAIGILADVMSLRLREVLREDRGATYGASVNGQLAARPREAYSFEIEFGCAPERSQELIDAVFTEIDSLQTAGATATEIAKIKEVQRRTRETELKENGFWISALEAYYTLGLDPREILDYGARIDGITAASVRDSARRYLKKDRYVLGILSPEKTGAEASPTTTAQEDGGTAAVAVETATEVPPSR